MRGNVIGIAGGVGRRGWRGWTSRTQKRVWEYEGVLSRRDVGVRGLKQGKKWEIGTYESGWRVKNEGREVETR